MPLQVRTAAAKVGGSKLNQNSVERFKCKDLTVERDKRPPDILRQALPSKRLPTTTPVLTSPKTELPTSRSLLSEPSHSSFLPPRSPELDFSSQASTRGQGLSQGSLSPEKAGISRNAEDTAPSTARIVNSAKS
jgi:hypothetical protein